MRTLVFALLLAACGATVGCGDDDARTGGAPQGDREPFVTLAEAEGVIERAVPVVRTGGEAEVAGVDGEPDREETSVVEAARYETQSGREFDLFVYASAATARRASSSIADVEDGGSAIRAVNAVAAFPGRYDRVDAYRAVARSLRRLAVACDRDEEDDAALRRVCVGERAVAPAGDGVDRDEAQDREEPIVVAGLHYDPLIARRLNPNIAPDKAMLSGRTPPAGKIWFGVFLRVCNRGERVRTSSEDLVLVDAFGQRTKPSDALAAGNPYAYRPSSVEPGECLPRAGSVAERSDGALVLFAVSGKVLEERPIALEVADQQVILDV